MILAQTYSEFFHEIGRTEIYSWDSLLYFCMFVLMYWCIK